MHKKPLYKPLYGWLSCPLGIVAGVRSKNENKNIN